MELMPFFAIGAVLNIATFGVFLIWAFRQWKKKK